MLLSIYLVRFQFVSSIFSLQYNYIQFFPLILHWFMAYCCIPLATAIFYLQGIFWWRDEITFSKMDLLFQKKLFGYYVFYVYSSSVVIKVHFKAVRFFLISLPFKNTINSCVYIEHSRQIYSFICCLLFQWHLITKLSLLYREHFEKKEMVKKISWLTWTWQWTSINYIVPA